MPTIPLNDGTVAHVDDDDFAYVSQFKWSHLKKPTGSGYAIRHEDGKTIQMHREVAQTPDDLICDHINGDGLDNRRCNLRNIPKGMNGWNRRPNRNSSSKYIGVTWSKRNKKWLAQIGFCKQVFYIGVYEREEEAAAMRDLIARELWGELAYQNLSERS